EEEARCVLHKEEAGRCVLTKEAEAARCVLVKEEEARCVLTKEADADARCVLHKADEEARCVLTKEADAGRCVLAKDEEARCVLHKAEEARCVLSKEAARCVLVTDSKDEKTAVYLDRLNAWDLSIVKKKVVRDGIFAADEVDAIEQQYKHFLALSCAQDAPLHVDPRMDDFWHAHILFTQDYAAMCQAVAGQFLHHRPSILDEA
ncbi:MAG: hypothetical protein ACTHPD_09640, partial [Rhizomicrobium sp.]